MMSFMSLVSLRHFEQLFVPNPSRVPGNAAVEADATDAIVENNAGVTPEPFADTTLDEIDRGLDINL